MSFNNLSRLSRAVEAQATYYPHMVSIFIPNQPFFREPKQGLPRIMLSAPDEQELQDDAYEDDLERSLRRTKKRISDYVLCNHFELFITFTFSKNRQNIDQKRQQMSDWLRNQRNRNGKFDYLIIPELHKDGALHFHALFNGYCGTIQKAINPKTGKELIKNGENIYNIPEYTLGFTSAKNISSDQKDQAKVAFYLKKYITKNMPMFYNRQRYWASKDLKSPITEDNPEKWYEIVKPDWQTETDYGRILRFNLGSNPFVDLCVGYGK